MSAALPLADSGSLIALARLDLLGLPARYFETVLVPSSVWEKVRRKPREDERARLSPGWEAYVFRVVPNPKTVLVELTRANIDAGERYAIARGLELDSTLLIGGRLAILKSLEPSP